MVRIFLYFLIIILFSSDVFALTPCDNNRLGEVFVDTGPNIRAGENETLVALLCGKTGWKRLNNTVVYQDLDHLNDTITGIPCGGPGNSDDRALAKGVTAIINDIDGTGKSAQLYCDGVRWKNSDGSDTNISTDDTLADVLVHGNKAGTNQIDMENQKIVNLSDATNDTDAANRGEVKRQIEGSDIYYTLSCNYRMASGSGVGCRNNRIMRGISYNSSGGIRGISCCRIYIQPPSD